MIEIKNFRVMIMLGLVLQLMYCVPKTGIYDLPSISSEKKPEWVSDKKAQHDTVFVVIHLPSDNRYSFQEFGQMAQSELNKRLSLQLDHLLVTYYQENQMSFDPKEQFTMQQKLALINEKLMRHVDVADAWKKDNEVLVLCTLDVENTLQTIISELAVPESSFRSHFSKHQSDFSEGLKSGTR